MGVATGPGVVVSAGVGAVVGGVIGGFVAARSSANAAAKLATWGLFRLDPLKTKMKAYAREVEKDANYYEKRVADIRSKPLRLRHA